MDSARVCRVDHTAVAVDAQPGFVECRRWRVGPEQLDVVLDDDESPEAGVREAHDLMGRLGIEPSHLVDVAYVDLLAGRGV